LVTISQNQSVTEGMCLMADGVYITVIVPLFSWPLHCLFWCILCRRFLSVKWNQPWMRLYATEKQLQHVLLVSGTIHDAGIIAYCGHETLLPSARLLYSSFYVNYGRD